ncbi:AraC family transcriptional regulator [Bradymonadaceae bacterium TMQ3]|uniref:AraC family transcriptional regulator n=1 Tax=Lujinxingia sediminis TaxID=2480984 RepID=A0ABY0CS74_9DELT|nr:GyrI-like domain-containing protein [Lujinxingia sediminis]RDV37703.1 AraC family transcriptional regulator [Bradymonadaceae bacterium TMQ3]RVU43111.1 AraC family transcriptional regulator [Lujinxingia sediminis]TXC75513.1 AraC family transcriptional regulator [Bradymonadales bacterium TMQ1]
MTSEFTTPQRIPGLRHTTTEDYLTRMANLQAYITDHLDDDLAPDTLARVAAMSKHHFHRVFRGMFGESVAEHLRRLRLERAAIQVRRSERPLLRIAVDAGYGSHEAFTRAFKSHFDLTPSQLREALPPHYDRRLSSELRPTLPEAPLDVELRHRPASPIIMLRHWGPYLEIGPAFDRLLAWALERGLDPEAIELCGAYHDDPEITAAEQLRSDACVVHRGHLQGTGEYVASELPGGTFAVVLHRGPYETLYKTYLRLIGHWLPSSGYEPVAEPLIERYLNHPAHTPPEDLLTEVWARLQPTSAHL